MIGQFLVDCLREGEFLFGKLDVFARIWNELCTPQSGHHPKTP